MRSRWIFTEQELLNPKQCRQSDLFLVTDSNLPEVGVFVFRDGKVTNKYGDGTRGVTKDHADIADSQETYHTIDRKDIADNWRDVRTTANGRFLKFALNTRNWPRDPFGRKRNDDESS